MRIGRIHQIIAVSLTGAVAGAVAAAPAHAASGGTLSMVGGVVTFTAGNAYNKMSLVVVGDTMTISDSGAPITIAGGLAGTCRALASASVGCEGVHSVSMSLGAGEDTATIVSWRKVTVYAGGGGDVVDARNSTGTMVLWGQGGEDTLKSGDGEDELQGGDAKDHLVAGDGRDWVYGGAGDDDVYGGHGDDHVYGGPDNDHVYGGPDVDFVYGGSGDDFVHGDQGRGFVYGEEGDDQGYGHAEDDLIVLGPGRNQRAYAHGGHDVCRGDDVTVRVGCEES